MPPKQAIGIVALLLFVAGTAHGQFTTVINLPGDPAPTSIDAGTQLNIFAGGQLGPSFATFTAHGGEVNVAGGSIDPTFVAKSDTVVNVTKGSFNRHFILDETSHATITGGLFGEDGLFRLLSQSTLEISGGEFHRRIDAGGNSQATISGGRVLDILQLRDNAEATLSGGLFVFADHLFSTGSSLLIEGGDFRVDGVPVGGLSTPGAQQQVQLETGQFLSATLADGSPFTYHHLQSLGSVVLQATPPPPAPAIVTVPPGSAPLAVRDGQTLTLGPGGELGSHFVASWNSTLNAEGGQVGALLRAYGATVNITGGKIGPDFRAERSTVSIEGGKFSDVHFTYGSVADISGGGFTELRVDQAAMLALRDGEVETLRAVQGRIHMMGGHITGDVQLTSDSRFTLVGGILSGPLRTSRSGNQIHVLGGTIAGPLSVGLRDQLHIRGGSFIGDLAVRRDSDLTIYGTHFALPPTGDGPEIDLMSLLEPNVPYLLDIHDTTLTATLADGSPFELDLFTFPVPGHDFVDPDARVYLVLVQVPEPAALLIALSLVPLACMTRGRSKRPPNL